MKEIERFFRPEFINRLDDVIVFRPLTRDDLVSIVDFETNKVAERLKEQGLVLELDEPAKTFLIDKGYNPDFGARPLRRAIANYIEDPLSEMLLSGDLHGKNVIKTTRRGEDDHLSFEPSEGPANGGNNGDGGDNGDQPQPAGDAPVEAGAST